VPWPLARPRGEQGPLYDQRKAKSPPRKGIRRIIIHKSEFTTKADKILHLYERDIMIFRALLS
jgi:hypothetical protein